MCQCISYKHYYSSCVLHEFIFHACWTFLVSALEKSTGISLCSMCVCVCAFFVCKWWFKHLTCCQRIRQKKEIEKKNVYERVMKVRIHLLKLLNELRAGSRVIFHSSVSSSFLRLPLTHFLVNNVLKFKQPRWTQRHIKCKSLSHLLWAFCCWSLIHKHCTRWPHSYRLLPHGFFAVDEQILRGTFLFSTSCQKLVWNFENALPPYGFELHT